MKLPMRPPTPATTNPIMISINTFSKSQPPQLEYDLVT